MVKTDTPKEAFEKACEMIADGIGLHTFHWAGGMYSPLDHDKASEVVALTRRPFTKCGTRTHTKPNAYPPNPNR